MCGIAGFLDSQRRSGPDEMGNVITQMARSLHHRGPDDHGSWIDTANGIALGHTRLAIIDLSPNGAQPMVSSCGRFVLSYNGEVFNAPDLRTELRAAGRSFRGHSDTEVIVEGIAAWGMRPTLERLIGMFAFAAWDRQTRTLTLARDRVGIKPLYWGHTKGRLVFASELKALRRVPGWTGEINRDALASYLRYGYVPTPLSIYRGIEKLAPGTFLECAGNREARSTVYWSLAEIAIHNHESPLDVSDAATEEMLETLLIDAVKRRMVSDVPLGALLSGGIDSSAVTALMQANTSQAVRTFSIGFHERAYDEARHAKQVASHLGTDHTELYVTPAEARAVIPKLPQIYDEPFGDSSQIPTYLVSEMTRKHVTVALSGDGGDELFAGYNRYGQGRAIAKSIRSLPMPVRAGLSAGIKSITPTMWDLASSMVPRRVRPRLLGDKMHKLANILLQDPAGFYGGLMTQWPEASSLVLGGSEPQSFFGSYMQGRFTDDVSWMQYLDMLTYLPDDILTKVDRASMAVGLEIRVPLLDHRIVEFSWRLPQRLKIRRGKSKWLLRQIAHKYVPKKLLDRPKMGFGVPIDIWLRGPLKEWAGDLLNSSVIDRAGLLDPTPIANKWAEHQSGTRNWQHFLWNVLMFEAWRLEAATRPGDFDWQPRGALAAQATEYNCRTI